MATVATATPGIIVKDANQPTGGRAANMRLSLKVL